MYSSVFNFLSESLLLFRYFCGVASSPKLQRVLIESFFNECFKKNKSRGRDGKHPLTYEECQEVASRVMAANKVTNFSNYFSGDPYLGSRGDELKKKNERISELEQEVKRLKAQLGQQGFSRGNFRSPSSGVAPLGDRTAEDKRARYYVCG